MRLWRLGEAGAKRTLGALPDHVAALAFSPEGDRLAVGGEEGTARVYDLATEAVTPLPRSARQTRSIAIAGNAIAVAAGELDGAGEAQLVPIGGTAGATLAPSMGATPGAQWVVFGAGGSVVRVQRRSGHLEEYDARDGAPRGVPLRLGTDVGTAAISSDESRIAVARPDRFELYRFGATTPTTSFPDTGAAHAGALIFSAAGDKLMTVGSDLVIRCLGE